MPADKGYNNQNSFRTSNADDDDSDGDGDDDGDDDSEGDADDDADDDVVQPADKGCSQVSLRTAHTYTHRVRGKNKTHVKKSIFEE